MGTRSTVKGYWRQAGNSISNQATPGPVAHFVPVEFDAAQANTTATGVFLPKGGIVRSIQVYTEVVGGTTPTFDLGIAGTADGYLNGQASDANAQVGIAAIGSLGDGIPLTADTELTAGTDGVGTDGVGNVTCMVEILMLDDGKHNN